MVVKENTVRVETYKAIYDLINSYFNDAVSGWTIVSAYPEVNPVFPCIVINPATVSISKESLNFGIRQSEIMVQIDFYTKANTGKKAIDEAKDAVHNLFLESVTILNNANLSYNDLDDVSSDSFTEGEQKLNYGGLVVRFKLNC